MNWFNRLFPRTKSQYSRRAATFRPTLEALEERYAPAANVLQTNLVSDVPGMAQNFDPNLSNPWGIAESATSPFWVSDNNAGVSTLYNTQGVKQALVVGIPTPIDPTGSTVAPTGIVFNTAAGAGAFKLPSPNGKAATFIFDTEDGTIVAWNNSAGTEATIVVDNSGNNFTNPDPSQETGAVYKGLTIATGNGPIISTDSNSTTLLYAANFRSGNIDVFDTNFNQVSLPAGAFTDPNLPAGYAPFNVQDLNGKIYVTYAKQDANKHDDVAGQGNGFVDVYNLNGTGLQRLVTQGPLDSPWGLTLAPQGFAGITAPNNDPVLLVGNFGNGRINAFDAKTGAFLTGLNNPDGQPIQIFGLWSLQVGNGGNGGLANTVYFTAGPDHETEGLFGSLTSLPVGVNAINNTLYIVGDDNSSYVSITPIGAKTDGSTGIQVNSLLGNVWTSQTFTQNFTAVHVDLGNGSNFVSLSSSLTLPAFITEGNGSDYVQTGAGTNVINLGTGYETVFAGAGNNTVSVSAASTSGGYFHAGDGANAFTLGNGWNTVQTGNGNNTITAGNGGGYFQAGNGNNTITVGAGSNTIQFGGGNNTISAGTATGSGYNSIQTGGGNNTITVLGQGGAYVQVGSGQNVIELLNAGYDYVTVGGGGHDLIVNGLGPRGINLGGTESIVVDGTASLTQSGDTLQSILSDFISNLGNHSAATALVQSRLQVATSNTSGNDQIFGQGDFDVILKGH